MSADESISTVGVILRGWQSWPDWYKVLQYHASSRRIWHLIDPDAPDVGHINDLDPKAPKTIHQMITQRDNEQQAKYQHRLNNWENADEITRGDRPSLPIPTKFEDIERLHSAQLKEYAVLQAEWSKTVKSYTHLSNWINATVQGDLMATAQMTNMAAKRWSLQDTVRALKSRHAPSNTAVINIIRTEYRRALDQASEGRVDIHKWHKEWIRVYERARAHGIAEAQGDLATKDFLKALSQKLAPTWAANELTTLIANEHLGRPTETLDNYNRVFAGIIQEAAQDKSSKASGIFATIGKRSDSPSSSKTRYSCPCKKEQAQGHYWLPEDCSNVEIAITGSTKRRMHYKPAAEYKQAIITRLNKPAWKDLKEKLEKKYNRKIENLESGPEKSSTKYPGSINAAVIDPMLMMQGPGEGIYATLDFSRHPLSASTLMDNCGATQDRKSVV